MHLFLNVLGLHCCRDFPLVAASWVYFLVAVLRLLTVASRCRAQVLGHAGFCSCGTWAQQLWLLGSRAQIPQLWHIGLVALWHVGSSQIRDQICVSCIGKWILYHLTTREAQDFTFYMLSGTMRCSRVTVNFLCPSVETNQRANQRALFFLINKICRNQDLDMRRAHCYWCVTASRPFQWTELGVTYISVNSYIDTHHIYTLFFIS